MSLIYIGIFVSFFAAFALALDGILPASKE